MFGKFARFFEWLDAFLSLWGRLLAWLSTAGAGAVSYWGASVTQIMSGFAPLSYILAGLIGAALFSFMLACIGWLRLALAKGSLLNRMSRPTMPVNPLDDSFTRQRIKLVEFIDPTQQTVQGKTFVKCELMGPANLLFTGCNMGALNQVACDFIELPSTTVKKPYNAILFVDCTFTDCTFLQSSLFMDPGLANAVRKMAPNLYWLAGHHTGEY